MRFGRHGGEAILAQRADRGFTLFEMMMAIAVLALVFTAVTVSLRGKWRVEEARRGAQRLALAWVKARSHAWREGREWIVEWDASRGMVRGMPLPISQEGEGVDERLSPGFSFEVGRGLQVFSEGVAEEEVPPVHFFANQRVTTASVVVTAPGRPRWRVRMDWDGRPVLEPAGMAPAAADGRGPPRRPVLEKRGGAGGAESPMAP